MTMHRLQRRENSALDAEATRCSLSPRGFGPSPTHAEGGARHSLSHLSVLAPQAKLTVNQPGDKYEQEADSVADSVLRMGDSQSIQREGVEEDDEDKVQMKPLAGAISPLVQRAEKDDEEEEEGPVQAQRKENGDGLASADVSGVVSQGLSSGGQPLDGATRAFMEPRFGHDFSQVRVHTDARASQSSEAIAARAYTVGSDIAFRSGEFSPGSSEGKRLLAHELTHVVQQDGGSAAGVIQRSANPEEEEQLCYSQAEEDEGLCYSEEEEKPVVIDTDKIAQAVMDDLNRLADKEDEEEEHWYNFRRPLSYQTGQYDLLDTTSYYDTGNSFKNFFTNFYFSVVNILTLPVNAASEVASLPDRAIEAAGYDPGEFDFVMMMTGMEEFNASQYRSGATPEPTPAPRRVPEPEPTPKPKPPPEPKATPPPAPKPAPEPEPMPGKTRPTRTETNMQQAEKLRKQLEKGLEDARKPRIQKNWRNNLREMVKSYKTAVFDVGSDKIALTKERMNHILRRHHPDCWDGTVASQQSFFDAKMTTDDISNLVRNAINQNRSKILAAGIENNITVEGVVDGYHYVATIAHGEVAQFYVQ